MTVLVGAARGWYLCALRASMVFLYRNHCVQRRDDAGVGREEGNPCNACNALRLWRAEVEEGWHQA